jgi:hypothetical protein
MSRDLIASFDREHDIATAGPIHCSATNVACATSKCEAISALAPLDSHFHRNQSTDVAKIVRRDR